MKISAGPGYTLEWKGKEVLEKASKVTQKTCNIGSKIVAGQARNLVPVDTGTLRRAIDIKRSRFETGGYAVIAQGAGNYDRFYALFVEIGTGYGARAKARPGKPRVTKPKEYLRPALENAKPTLERIHQRNIASAFPASVG